MSLKPLLYLCCFLCSFYSFGQEYSISGFIKNEVNQPVAFTNIVLLQKEGDDFKTLKGTSSNDNGSYILDNIPKGSYLLRFTFVGFKPHEYFLELDSDRTYSLTLIEDNSELNEVILTARKPTVTKLADRLVFNVEHSALSNGSILDVLKSTPSVFFMNNKIHIKKSVPDIFINNRKVNLTGDELTQLLENSAADAIKSIEVITSPSAQYDASSDVIINIVMSKNLITGYRGSVYTNYTQGVFPRYNVGTSSFFKNKKINFYTNYSYTNKKINRASNELIQYPNTLWNTDINRNTWSETHAITALLDYTLDDKNTLSFGSNSFLIPYFKYKTNAQTTIAEAEVDDINAFNSLNLSHDLKYNLGFDLGYKHHINENSNLKINSHYTNYDYEREQSVASTYYKNNNEFYSNTAFNTDANQKTTIFSTQIDYDLTLNDESSLYLGVKSAIINTDNGIIHNDVNTVSNEETHNTQLSDSFNYDESVTAAYISYDKNWKKFSFSGGLRYEHTSVKGISGNNNLENTQYFSDWFPTLNLTYNAFKKASLYTNYKRSIERPSYKSLNPFSFYINDLAVVKGNPNLKPAYTDKFVFGSTIQDKYTVEFYYTKSYDGFVEVQQQKLDTQQIIYQQSNIGKAVDFGLDFITYFDVIKDWSVFFVSSIYKTEYETLFGEELFNQKQWTFYIQINNSFTFLKNRSLTANFSFDNSTKTLRDLQSIKPLLFSNLTVTKTLFNKKGLATLSIEDIFNKQDFSTVANYPGQNNTRFMNEDNRYIKLGFTYKFGNTSLKTNNRSNSIKERDRL